MSKLKDSLLDSSRLAEMDMFQQLEYEQWLIKEEKRIAIELQEKEDHASMLKRAEAWYAKHDKPTPAPKKKNTDWDYDEMVDQRLVESQIAF